VCVRKCRLWAKRTWLELTYEVVTGDNFARRGGVAQQYGEHTMFSWVTGVVSVFHLDGPY
jgi:hypothetical protein